MGCRTRREGFSRDLEIPKVRNGLRTQRGLSRGLGVLRVGCQSEKRLAKDFLRLRMVSAFTSSWLRLGLGGAGFELGVRGSPGSSNDGWWHILAGFLSQLWFGGTSSKTWAAGPGLLCGGWPSARSGTCLAGLTNGTSRAWGFLGRALALLPSG